MDGNHEVRRARLIDLLRRAGWFLSGMAVLGACLLARAYAPAGSASAAGKPEAGPVKKASATSPAKALDKPSAKTPVPAAPKKPPVVAVVNNEPIAREELARECLLHYGQEVLEAMTNRMLILSTCQQRNITITDKQIDDEIDRMARQFSLPSDQWLKVLEKERGIKPLRYAKDIIWPTLALKELAKNQLTVTRQEIDEAYESEFGPAVKVRLIALDKAEEARLRHAEALAKPDEFGTLAKKYSQDANSASAYGLIQPIRRHMGDPKLEAAAFALRPGQISNIIQVGNLFVFVKCEEHLPPTKDANRAKIEPQLVEAIKNRKLHAAASEILKQLQDKAEVQIVYGDKEKTHQMPGVAAVINGQKITVLELAEECIDRYGSDVLEGVVHRRLLDQALKQRNQKVSEADIQAEMARAAMTMGVTKSDGTPDVEALIARTLENEGVTREIYLRDEVWPSVALKKLVGDKIPVTKEDLERGYEANYGPKVRCRAIVLQSARKAQEVWDMARKEDSLKYFGDLAEQYSIDPNSRSLRGEVPPIRRFGGQPALEKEAFQLSPENRLSGIIQIAGTFVILYYEGQTESIGASFDEVRDLLYRDVHEKKLRIAMGKTFDELKETAKIDNYLANNFKLPKKEEQDLAADPSLGAPKPVRR